MEAGWQKGPRLTPVGSGHSRNESTTPLARLTVLRGWRESMTMQKWPEGASLCLLATRFASLTFARKRSG